jgi:hypothetical protein
MRCSWQIPLVSRVFANKTLKTDTSFAIFGINLKKPLTFSASLFVLCCTAFIELVKFILHNFSPPFFSVSRRAVVLFASGVSTCFVGCRWKEGSSCPRLLLAGELYLSKPYNQHYTCVLVFFPFFHSKPISNACYDIPQVIGFLPDHPLTSCMRFAALSLMSPFVLCLLCSHVAMDNPRVRAICGRAVCSLSFKSLGRRFKNP